MAKHYLNTYGALNAIFGLEADNEFAGQMIAGMLDPANQKENTGDTDYFIETAWDIYLAGASVLMDGHGKVSELVIEGNTEVLPKRARAGLLVNELTHALNVAKFEMQRGAQWNEWYTFENEHKVMREYYGAQEI